MCVVFAFKINILCGVGECKEHRTTPTKRNPPESHTRSEEHTSELQCPRDLPSFPTRRSSDLCASFSPLKSIYYAVSGNARNTGPPQRNAPPLSPILDPKSTRLNSSAPEISPLSLHDALPIYVRRFLL